MRRDRVLPKPRAKDGAFVVDESLPPLPLFEEWFIPLIFLTLFGLGVAGVVMADGDGGMFALGVGMMVLAVGSASLGLWPFFQKMRKRRAIALGGLSLPRWPLRLGESVQVSLGSQVAGVSPSLVSARLVCREEVRGLAEHVGRIPTPRAPTTLRREVRSIDVECHPRNDHSRGVDHLDLRVPHEAAPTFVARSNKVLWELNVRVDSQGVERDATFPLLVIPEVVA